jgi:hypothetical protein
VAGQLHVPFKTVGDEALRLGLTRSGEAGRAAALSCDGTTRRVPCRECAGVACPGCRGESSLIFGDAAERCSPSLEGAFYAARVDDSSLPRSAPPKCDEERIIGPSSASYFFERPFPVAA